MTRSASCCQRIAASIVGVTRRHTRRSDWLDVRTGSTLNQCCRDQATLGSEASRQYLDRAL
jgi:hypothetical protein